MKRNKLILWTSTAALAGFLFGFDTVVISGANLPIKDLWQTSPLFHGTFIMSMALWGTVIGAVFGGIPTSYLGRKKTLLLIGVLYALSALGSALAGDPYSFSFFRFIGGLGVGVSSVVAPTYLSEIAPANKRGRLVALYQFMIVFGILIAFFSNYLLKGFGGANDWRFMLGIETIPAVIYTAMVLFIPESPRWLIINKKNDNKAQVVLAQMGVSFPEKSIQEIKSSVTDGGRVTLWRKKYSYSILLAFFIAFFNQLSGINFILYYAPEILERAGLATRESLMSSVSIGIINLLFTMLGMVLIDRLGRKTLLLWGSFGYIVSLVMVALSFYFELSSGVLLSFILLFIAAHAIGQGAVIWVFIAEIFPNKVRAYGQSFGASIHWIFAALITLITPVFLDAEEGLFGANPWPIFAFFAFFMVLQLLWVLFKVPETKGKSLEQLGSILLKTKGKDQFGEVLWDVFPSGKKMGGAPYNVAAHAQMNKIRSEMISCVGDDELGAEILSEVKKQGLSKEFISIHPAYPSGTVNIQIDDGGQPSYEISEPVAWDHIACTDDLIRLVKHADVFVFGTLASRNQTSRGTLIALLPHAKLKVLDLNIRQSFYTKKTIQELLGQTDILKINDDEYALLTELLNCREADLYQTLSKDFNIDLIITTKGAEGAEAYAKGEVYHAPGIKVQVADTVGSGDAFLATFLVQYLNRQDINVCLKAACQRGAFVASKGGAIPKY